MDERVKPIRLTDNNGIIKNQGDVYELDFSRDSIVFAESRGFKIDEISTYPVTRISELFYYSFRKNHRGVSREKTDKFMEEWGGVPEKVLKRLTELYTQSALSNNIQTDEEAGKNEAVTVEM